MLAGQWLGKRSSVRTQAYGQELQADGEKKNKLIVLIETPGMPAPCSLY